MANRIQDGTGTNNFAKVSTTNKLLTRSTSEDVILEAAKLGLAYNLNTGDVGSLANGESVLLYFKNNEEQDFIVNALAVGIKDASGSNIHTVKIYRNPTSVSFSTAVDMNSNRNFGSAQTLADSLAYKGVNGSTQTGGTEAAQFYMNESGRLFATVDFVLPKSTSMAVSLILSLSAGTTTAYLALIGHLEVE